jgi:mitotic spindle assembly checkpoint protein MAD2
MAATSTRSKNTISLKGSAAIVAEYFNYAVNKWVAKGGSLLLLLLLRYLCTAQYSLYCLGIYRSILYQRGIYPTDSFRQEQHYGLSIMVSKDQGLTAYLQTVTKQMSCAHLYSML